MTWASPKAPSLLETTDTSPCEWWLVYSNFSNPHWYGRLLKDGFQHVFAMKRDGRVWVMLNLNVAYLEMELIRTDLTVAEMFPEATVQRVVSLRPMTQHRWPWVAGPVTCVELCKAVLGIPNFFIWTPFQLYKHCRKGVLTWHRHRKHQSRQPKTS